ncbi:MAG: Na/Pi cotransporter family protein [Bacteroidaceae bacterium]|nr:Na/Pi cotransporter family protein [Bacteroidaceae bacterium]MBR6856142.1 Na/Pi cotransporter family protein [Bacteroidaceae bacterium]
MDSLFYQILTMLGCLALFLWGMNLMSSSLQRFAGKGLRSFIEKMTSNTGKCLFTGFLVTVLVQSSTATTLMLVSFVNAGLMTLKSAIGVIMGANIGTTVTAWLFAVSMDGTFSLGAIAIPLIFVGFVLTSFFKKQKTKDFGSFLIGFAFLFLGLSMLKDTSYPLLSSQPVRDFLAPITDMGLSTVLFIIIGAVMTFCLQSSAAATSITMLLLASGAITFPNAVAFILGENIGTTITSNLAATSTNVSSKRTARAHLVFNLFGSILVIALFRPYMRLNAYIVEAMGFPNPLTADFSILSQTGLEGAALNAQITLASSLPYSVAIVHSLFNIITTLILVWFIPQLEKLVMKMVPNKEEEKEVFHLVYIGKGNANLAELSITEARKEINHFGEICTKGFGYVRQAIQESETDRFEDFRQKLVKYEEITDRIEFEIASYLNQVSQNEISDQARMQVKAYFKIIGEMESLGDSGEAISRLLQRKRDHGKVFNDLMRKRIDEMLDTMQKAYDVMNANLAQANVTDITDAYVAEDAINNMRDSLREEHLKNMEVKSYDYTAGVYYFDLIQELETMGDFMINISQALQGLNA